MTRIIAGTAGGRTLRTPPGSGTRPTSDRVREAVFSALDARDAVRGLARARPVRRSGALGLEAASRGAASVVLVESDRRAADVIAGNARDLGSPASASLGPPSAAHLAADPSTEEAAHLVFVDPPYDLDETALGAVLDRLRAGWLAPGGLLVVERSTRAPSPPGPTASAGAPSPRSTARPRSGTPPATERVEDQHDPVPPAAARPATASTASCSTAPSGLRSSRCGPRSPSPTGWNAGWAPGPVTRHPARCCSG